MSQGPSADSTTLESTDFPEVASLVRDGLSNRLRPPTLGEERRLAKTLERLRPAANIALARVSFETAETDITPEFSSAEFASVLHELANE
jgi:hypothetical protein